MLQYVVVEIIVVALAVGFTSLYCWLETTDIERFVVYLLGVVVVTLDLSIFVTMGMSIKWRNSISLLYISRALIIFNC